MGTIADLNNKLKVIDIQQIIVDSIEATSDKIIELNQGDNQLLGGYLSTGDRIVPYYASLTYALMKNELNSLPGLLTPDLRLTGGYYSGFFVVVSKAENSFTVDSSDPKAAKLEDEYSPYVYGLNQTNTSIYALKYLQPQIISEFKSQSGL